MGDAVLYIFIGALIIASVAVITFSLTFRNEIRDWMRRTTGIGPDGLALTPPERQQAVTAAAERVQQQALAAPAIVPDPSLEHWARQVREAVDHSGLRGTPELIPQLEHAMAIGSRLIDFHVAARNIFGTQVAVLRNLEAAHFGLTLDDLRPTFQEHVNRVEAANIQATPDILSWINFLITQRLAAVENARYHITPAGREFLPFAVSLGVTEAKAF
jgi:hypothetical protein